MVTTAQLTPLGVWSGTDGLDATANAAFAKRVESLGYSALWIPDTVGRDPFVNAAMMLSATDRLVVATGIANIHVRHPGMMKQGAHSLAEMSDGRFVLGLGVSHAPIVEGLRKIDYRKPLTTMRTYLEAMDQSPYMATKPSEDPPVVLAALGPKMLELSRDRTRGAHPYWTTPEHTAGAREILGPDAWLCVEQKCVLTTDRDVAHAKAIEQLSFYITLPNYVNNWLRLGFTEEEITGHAPRFLDAVVAWGDLEAISARLEEHRDAGASHVCVQSVHPSERFGTVDWDLLEALAPGV